MNRISRNKKVLSLIAAAVLAVGATASWAQDEVAPNPGDGTKYGYKYRADMACGESWIKVCEI